MGSFSPRTAAETCSSISPLSSVPALVLSTRVKQSNIRLSAIAARSLRTTLKSVDRGWSLATSRPCPLHVGHETSPIGAWRAGQGCLRLAGRPHYAYWNRELRVEQARRDVTNTFRGEIGPRMRLGAGWYAVSRSRQ